MADLQDGVEILKAIGLFLFVIVGWLIGIAVIMLLVIATIVLPLIATYRLTTRSRLILPNQTNSRQVYFAASVFSYRFPVSCVL